MPETIDETKRALRRQCRQIRDSLGEEIRRETSQAICGWIETWPLFQQSETILTYIPIRAEVDLRPLLDRHPHKRWLLPRILPEGRMVFHPYDPDRLIRHPYGMLEPSPDLPVITADEIGLALVPGLAFDRQGWRLGYGGGFFDRFLSAYNGISSGVTYAALLLDHLPHRSHDVTVQYVATEDGISNCPTLDKS
jgi:5-formyltetrahydrofolate cyclo-ligase